MADQKRALSSERIKHLNHVIREAAGYAVADAPSQDSR
jgi:hypothetical protein